MDPHVAKAAKLAASNPELTATLETQQKLDRVVLREMEIFTAPEGLRETLAAIQAAPPEKGGWKRQIFQPAILGVILGILLIIGFSVYFWMTRGDDFQGVEQVQEMLSVAQNMTGRELEPVSKPAGEMGDWLFLKYGLENFVVPQEFASFQTVGSRLLKQDGHPIAQIAAEPGDVLFYVFRTADFGVVPKVAGQWHVLVQEDWVAALRDDGDTCFMVAMRGDEDTMHAFLDKHVHPAAK